MREISAGVPTNAPTPPAAIPMAAFVAKFGGFPSGELVERNERSGDQSIDTSELAVSQMIGRRNLHGISFTGQHQNN